MRIVQVTPGTGNFYCGTCLRDHALAKAMRDLGHEVVMVPLYLPLVLEEESEDDVDEQLYFGGLNVYLQQKSRLFRKAPKWFERLIDRPGLLRWVADHSGMTSGRDLGEITVSMLRGEDGRQAKELEKLVEGLEGGVFKKRNAEGASDTERDEETSPGPSLGGRGEESRRGHGADLVCLSNALLVGLTRRLKERLGVPVVCTLQGEQTFLDSLAPPYRDQAWAVLRERAAEVDGFVAVSKFYRDLMVDRLGLADNRVRQVYNGVDLADFEAAAAPSRPPVIGYLARLMAAKGLETLVDAYIEVKRRSRVDGVKLHVAGTMTSGDRRFVASLEGKLSAAGVRGDVTITPNVDKATKLALLRSWSVFSVPTVYEEFFGLYVLEAMAAGVPVVQPRHGAFVELLSATGGGMLCRPHDVGSLADAIESLLLDEPRRQAMGEAGRRGVFEQFGVERMAAEVAQFYDGVRIQAEKTR